MILWIDAQLSPGLAPWIRENFTIDAHAVRDLGLRDAADHEIFMAARAHGAVVMTKDRDFLQLLEVMGAPPAIIWLTCGNTSNARLRTILRNALSPAIALLKSGEVLVEIRDAL